MTTLRMLCGGIAALRPGCGVAVAAMLAALAQQAGAADALSIAPTGFVGIGRTEPVAPLDVGADARVNPHPAAVRGLYVTGDFPYGPPGAGQAPGVEFRHSNASQGIGFGYSMIYATGSNPDQNLDLRAQPQGKVRVVNSNFEVVGGTITGTGAVPRGAILMWSGNVTELPAGWALCNGEKGTPDLRGKFVAGHDARDPDYQTIGASTIGQKAITLPTAQTVGAHDHRFSGFPTTEAGANMTVSGTSGANGNTLENRPPFYVIAYIMFVGG